jgi:autotransporter-associated beta strand protein
VSLVGGRFNINSNYGFDLSFTATGNVLLNGPINTSGANGSIDFLVTSNGGDVAIVAGGYVKVGAALTASGGMNTNSPYNVNSNGGSVSITGAGGVTITADITNWNGYSGNNGYGSNGLLTINSGNGTATSGSGNGVNDGQVSGLLQGGNFEKIGSGIFILKGSNRYKGTTTVSAGVVRLGASNSIPTTSGLVLAGGEFQSAGFNNTAASIALSSNSILRLGSGAHTLTFTNLGSFTSGTMLTIEGWQGTYANPGATGTAGKIVFSQTPSATILDQLKFKNSGTGNLHTSIRLGTKEIVAGNQ